MGSGTGQLNYPLSEPSGIAVDAAGNVDVADFDNGRVQQFSSTGAFVEMWGWGVADGKSQFETCTSGCRGGVNGSGSGGLWDPDGMAIDSSGNVYVANLGSDLVQEYADPVTPVTHTLSVTDAGTGSGTITSNPTGIDCGSTCSLAFATGASVTLTATPTGGSTFTGWSGGGCSGTSTCVVTMNADTSVTATFTAAPVTHTLSVTDAGTGSVSSSPAGISCGVTCSAVFDTGSTVTLTATPTGGSTFTGWSGGGCSGASTCVVTMNADTGVTATFTPPAVPAPTVALQATTGVTATSATLNATVNPHGSATTYQFSYGTTACTTTEVPATPAAVGSDSTSHVVTTAITGLSPATTYRVCVTATNAGGPVTTPAQTFTTSPAPPTAKVETGTASDIGQVAATLRGGIGANGNDVTYHFEYGVNTSYGTSTPDAQVSANADILPVSAEIAGGLLPGTVYHFRLVATIGSTTIDGADAVFVTQPRPPTVATVQTLPISVVGPNSNSEVPAFAGIYNSATNLTYHFDYGATTAYGSSTPAVEAPAGTASITVVVPKDADHSLIVHYRLVVANAAGTAYGNDENAPAANPKKQFTASVVSAAATSARVSVSLTSSGAGDSAGTIPATGRFELNYGTGTSRDLHASVPVTLTLAGDRSTVSTATVTLTGLTPATLYTAVPSAVLNLQTESGAYAPFTITPLSEGPSVDPLILTAAAGVSGPTKVSGGKLSQVVTCEAGSTCPGSITLTTLTAGFIADVRAHAATATVAHVKFTARRGKKTKVVITLSKAARKTLDKRRSLKVGETVTIKGPHGTTKTKSVLTLRGH